MGQIPRVRAQLQSFMDTPVEAISSLQPLFELGLVDPSSTEALGKAIYSQAISLGKTVTMVYVGMEDGRFLGYYTRELPSSWIMAIRCDAAGAQSTAQPSVLATRMYNHLCQRKAG